MPDTTPIEEQEQVKRILERWFNFQDKKLSPYTVCSAVLIIAFIVQMALWIFAGWSNPQIFYLYFLFPLYGIWLSVSLARTQKKFVRQLTMEERRKIAEANVVPYHSVGLQRYIRSLEKELMRPSQQPSHNDSTLLRAATPHDDTASDQLLRPVNPSAE